MNTPIPAVGVFIMDQNGIYLIKKARGIFKDEWCTPGGKIEYGEDIISALKREVREEINISIDNIQFITYEESVQRDERGDIIFHFVFFNFKATYCSGDFVASDDALEVKYINFRELSNYIVSAPTIRTLKLLNKIL